LDLGAQSALFPSDTYLKPYTSDFSFLRHGYGDRRHVRTASDAVALPGVNLGEIGT